MFKLFDSMATGDQIALFVEVEKELKSALAGQSDQFLYNIDHYLANLPEVRASMAQRGRNRILHLAQEFGWKNNRNDLVDALDDTYLAIFQTLEDYVVIGIDMEKDAFPTALYTRSVAILDYLYKEGMIEDGIEPGKYMANLIGSKTEKSLGEGNFVTQRLDVIGMKEGKPCFRPMTPKSNLDIGGGKQYVIVPAPFMHMVETMMRVAFQQKPFRFTKSSVIGQVTHTATISQNVVREAYKGLDERDIESRLRKVTCGYDVVKQRFFAYDLEASLSSLGVASFRPEMLDSVHEVSDADIDKSRYNIDFNLLRGIFKTRIKGAKTAQLDTLKYIDLSGFANMRDKVQAILDAADRELDKSLYYLMKSHPELFGDLEEALEKRERQTPKFLKHMEFITLPEKESERVAVLSDLLGKGVVKLTSTSKSGSLFERTGSNNPQVLERMLGKDYVKNFESIRNKLYYIRDMMMRGEVTDRSQLEKIAVEYNILDYVDQEVFFSPKIDNQDASDALKEVHGAIQALIAKGASKQMAPSSLLYRDIHAGDPKEFFGNVNVNNIIAVEFSEA
jgi:hypothetical protein